MFFVSLRPKKRIFIISTIILFFILGLFSKKEYFQRYGFDFIPGFIVLVYGVWLWLDFKQYKIVYKDLEVYIRFFTCYFPVAFLFHIKKTRKTRWLRFIFKTLLFMVLLYFVFTLSSIMPFFNK